MPKIRDKKLHKLRYWREVLGLKQEDMAVLLGCNPSNYCQKELGKVEIKRTEMISIQTAFNKMRKNQGTDPLTMDEIFLP
jgi:DNA-binding XRE family transcriptional regulator